ncbi:MAG: hypothetical protein MI923_21535 [Phycisphaerales bacterium]|nr:hypothetical protein [Phycisphaerales bacterium]
MPIEVTCECGSVLKAPDEYRGRTGRCKKCGKTLLIEEVHEPVVLDESPREKKQSTRRKREYAAVDSTCSIMKFFAILSLIVGAIFLVNGLNGNQPEMGVVVFFFCLGNAIWLLSIAYVAEMLRDMAINVKRMSEKGQTGI